MKTPRVFSYFIALVLALILSGCGTVVQVDPTKEGKPAAGVTLTPIPQVVAGPQLLARTDTVKNGAQLVFATGKVFGGVFTGGESSRGRIELISAQCDESTSESWVIGKTMLTYTVTASLDVDGRRHVLTARGTGGTHHSYPNAMREAVEKATAELSAQVRALL
jgi:hypothetical protein